MDFLEFYAMTYNPFSKAVKVKDGLMTENCTQVHARLNHLLITGGIGVVLAEPGEGKTYAIRSWVDTLNKNTARVVYVCMSTLNTREFYRQLSYGLGLDPAFKKVDMFRDLQSRIVQLKDEQRMRVVVIVDEAQFLSTSILKDLVMLTNFDMDSRDPFSLVLVGQTYLSTILTRQPLEALRQRINVNYTFSALSQEETAHYITSMLKKCGADPDLFTTQAIATAYATCAGSLRRLASVITNALIIGANAQSRTIDEEMVRAAADEQTLG